MKKRTRRMNSSELHMAFMRAYVVIWFLGMVTIGSFMALAAHYKCDCAKVSQLQPATPTQHPMPPAPVHAAVKKPRHIFEFGTDWGPDDKR